MTPTEEYDPRSYVTLNESTPLSTEYDWLDLSRKDFENDEEKLRKSSLPRSSFFSSITRPAASTIWKMIGKIMKIMGKHREEYENESRGKMNCCRPMSISRGFLKFMEMKVEMAVWVVVTENIWSSVYDGAP